MIERKRIGFLIVSAFLLAAACPCLGYFWPIASGRSSAPVTSSFGARCLNGLGDFHAGIDVRVWSSRDVVAVDDGKVVYLPIWTGYENSIIVRHGVPGYYWYSGYHELDSIKVAVGDTVLAGQIIAKAGPTHLHFNYWDSSFNPDWNDNNTLHPLRIFGSEGLFDMCVYCPCVPVAALQVDHHGQLVEVGVGLAEAPYLPPFYTYVWNYEGNVRYYAQISGQYEPGDCYLGQNQATGVSPTDFQPQITNMAYFIFPAHEGDWIIDNPFYTYAIDVDGFRVTILQPVSDLYQRFVTNVTTSSVTVSWSVTAGGDVRAEEFFVKKGTSAQDLDRADIVVRQTGVRTFSFVDEDVVPGTTYRYVVGWNRGGSIVESPPIDAVIPQPGLRFSLSDPYPNPAREATSLSFRVPRGMRYSLSVYEITGRLVAVIERGTGTGAERDITWRGADMRGRKVAPGPYFIRLAVEGEVPITKKLLVVR